MNRHDARREAKQRRAADSKARKLAKRIGKAAEQLAQKWVTEGIEEMRRDAEKQTPTR